MSISLDHEIIVLGECKCLNRPARDTDINKIIRTIMTKPAPTITTDGQRREYVIFLPELKTKPRQLPDNITVVDGKRIFSVLKDASS